MRSFVVELLIVFPTGLAITFMLWVFWNLCTQRRRR